MAQAPTFLCLTGARDCCLVQTPHQSPVSRDETKCQAVRVSNQLGKEVACQWWCLSLPQLFQNEGQDYRTDASHE